MGEGTLLPARFGGHALGAPALIETPEQEHDLGTHHLPVRPVVLPCATTYLTLLRLAQLDAVLARHYQQHSRRLL